MQDARQMQKYLIANADYTVVDRSPFSLKEGELVYLGRKDPTWPGWIWIKNEDGKGSYVPEVILTSLEGETTTAKRDFAGHDLSVKKGERVLQLWEVEGWRWCQNEAGKEGWVPNYLLVPAT